MMNIAQSLITTDRLQYKKHAYLFPETNKNEDRPIDLITPQLLLQIMGMILTCPTYLSVNETWSVILNARAISLPLSLTVNNHLVIYQSPFAMNADDTGCCSDSRTSCMILF